MNTTIEALSRPSYRALAIRLRNAARMVKLAQCYRERVGELPPGPVLSLSPWSLAKAILAGVKFPVHDDMIYDFDHNGEGDTFVLESPMPEFVHFHGLDADGDFYDWDPPFQLALALFEAGEEGENINPYSPEATEWWEEHRERLPELPALADLDYTQVCERLQRLPAPFSGLYAIQQWCEGDTGYLFADIPCAYAHDMDLADLDWSAAAIRRLEEDYARADAEIFVPALELADLCARQSRPAGRQPEALDVCLRLACGLPVEYTFRDGELIVIETERIAANC